MARDHTARTRGDWSKLALVRGALVLVAAVAALAAAPGAAAGRPHALRLAVRHRGACRSAASSSRPGSPRRTARRRAPSTTPRCGGARSIGVTDQLELALPVEMRWRDGRRRRAVVHGEPVRHRGALPPRVAGSGRGAARSRRSCGVAVKRDVTARDHGAAPRSTSSRRTRRGRVHALIDLGVGRRARPGRRALRAPPGRGRQRRGRRRPAARRRGLRRARPRRRAASAGRSSGRTSRGRTAGSGCRRRSASASTRSTPRRGSCGASLF